MFVVPDGALHLVSFAALPTGASAYLVETGPVIHYLSTERDLVPFMRARRPAGACSLWAARRSTSPGLLAWLLPPPSVALDRRALIFGRCGLIRCPRPSPRWTRL